MDATVKDFLNEINELSSKKQDKEDVWRECQDDLTGYSYYWNTKTDEVTWQKPKTYKLSEGGKKQKKKFDLYIPPKAPTLPVATQIPKEKIKIYSIQQNFTEAKEVKKENVMGFRKPSDSDDEKIELITSYGGDSESETEENVSNSKKINKDVQESAQSDDDDDEVDLLVKIQKRANELKALGGDVPREIKNIIKKSPIRDKEKNATVTKNIAGFSLVAGYSDSEDEDDIEDVPAVAAKPEVAHSTLFPITKPVDVNDFIGPKPDETPKVSEENSFDNKTFKRKRRIGISLTNNIKKHLDVKHGVSEFKGLGFDSETCDEAKPAKENVYTSFQKGGVMFVKPDALNSVVQQEEKKSADVDNADSFSANRQETENNYTILKEKLTFLSEGREPVLPVQVMMIQAETLFLAMKENGLKASYLQNWLNDTCSELVKLEKDAAPEGWLLQWDRSHKRYYYQNQHTSESQWEYPQPDITRCDEAMDICTTPPPPPDHPPVPISPPLPPIIRCPTPPPPPIISSQENNGKSGVSEPQLELINVPLPAEVSPKRIADYDGEPLPPGVDMHEPVSSSSFSETTATEAAPSDTLSSAIDSFYSEIAAASETPSSTVVSSTTVSDKVQSESELQASPGEPQAKKKKKKVKLAQGLLMKKKGVSELVEKWKNVQKDF